MMLNQCIAAVAILGLSGITSFGITSASAFQPTSLPKPSTRTGDTILHANKKKSIDPNLDGTIPTSSTYEVTTVQELNEYYSDPNRLFRKKNDPNQIDYDALIAPLVVKGDTQILGSIPDTPEELDSSNSSSSTSSSSPFLHPVLKLIHDRRRSNSPLTPTTSTRPDGKKVALIVEGGGMRGCVTAGMVAAISYLGLEDTIDVIYGSSAGTIIGAYFNTRQLPWFGPEIYYDSLTTAGKRFIDSKRLLRTLGLGLLDPRLVKDVMVRPKYGKPVLNLDFLLRETMQVRKPLDWDKFVEMQKVQPLKVVASGLKSGKSVVFDLERGGFDNIEELAGSMHGSCLLPGIAGPIMNFDKTEGGRRSDENRQGKKFFMQNNVKDPNVEPLADALIYEPLPYRTAIAEGATDVIVLRSRPDGTDVTGKTSIFEKLIFRRFFRKKNKLRHIYDYMRRHGHKKLYAELVLELNEATHKGEDGDDGVNMMAIAVPPGSPEVTRLETRREVIFDGVRRGFARAYDALVEDPNERGRGAEVAKQVLPDEILDYDPLEIDAKGVSAFEYYLKQKEEAGEGYDLPDATAAEAGLPR
mmetsp:Transcript_4836/g.7291  ORF Transcript_4836/g.7291 Transcript_4836/m.7291 type:complete len:583 (-) Transcript_4836:1323-3071(-)